MRIAEFFERLAAMPAAAPAFIGNRGSLDYAQLVREIARLAAMLRTNRTRVLATALDNGAPWVIADLAALGQQIVHVPVPTFFTEQQTRFVLDAAGVDTFLTSAPLPGFETTGFDIAGERLSLCWRHVDPIPMIAGTAKITFTSGTTGAPKGVCLSGEAMLDVANGLASAMAPLAIRRHLCALPLAVLLENVAGIYAPLMAGAATVVVPTTEAGLRGSSRFDPSRLDESVARYRAESVIVLPQMLRAWTAWRASSRSPAASTPRFVAVGGAAVGAATLERARAVGLPAFEGYGLSEGASVQTLNLPGADRPGSVGRALPHASVRVAADGEIHIAGSLMLGYLGEPKREGAWWPTGDLGSIDDEGFLHLRGRKKHVIITAFGRNVSPEWVETALHAQPAIAHAVAQGDGKPALEAVLWPVHEAISDAALAQSVARANADLPDYARVQRFVRARVPFSPAAGVCTQNGRPLRRAIEELHAADFAARQRATDVLL
jgi:long-subunit acyl-CoA synthetase (AMP-forming)